MKNIIQNYINNQTRNTIIVHNEEVYNIEYLNIGKELSKSISSITNNNKLSLKSKDIIDKVLNNSKKSHNEYGDYIAIRNLGILFEDELKISIETLLDKYSKNNSLFILWEGEIEPNKLFFLSKENGIEVNIKNLSHIII